MKLECEKNYYTNGALRGESWYFRDKNNYIRSHREDGPAIIIYAINGSILTERYYVNDVRHRIDGPAWIEYHSDGYIQYEGYRLYGKPYKKEDYYKLPRSYRVSKTKRIKPIHRGFNK